MRSNLKGQRILLTGATGFVGSHLHEYFEKKGVMVSGFSSKTKKAGIRPLDIADKKQVQLAMKRAKPDAVIHLAGVSLVEHGQKNPYDTFLQNIKGTLNVLESARTIGAKRIVIASSMHVYGGGPLPHDESNPPRPSRPYETSKICADLIAQSYADSFHLPVLIPRFSNIYGPGDMNFSRLIPKTIRHVYEDGVVAMWGGDTIREYLHIEDVCRAYERLILLSNAAIEKNRIYNFCTGKPASVRRIINTIITLSKKDVQITKVKKRREKEIQKQLGSFEKAKTLLSWKPEVSIRQGLIRTLPWYEEFFLKTKNETQAKRRSARRITAA